MDFKKAIGVFIICFWLISLEMMANAAEPQFWVIGNNTGYSTISLRQLNAVFTGEVVLLPSKKPTTVVLHSSNTPECQFVADLYFKGSIPSLQKFWLSQVFQGRTNPPMFLATHAEILKYVSENEGAIAIVFSKEGIENWLIPMQAQ